MIVWPGHSSSTMTTNRSAALTTSGQSHTTLSGVRTMSTTSTISWNRKQAEARTALARRAPRPCTGSGRSDVGGGAASGRRWVRIGRRSRSRRRARRRRGGRGFGSCESVSVTSRNDTRVGPRAPHGSVGGRPAPAAPGRSPGPRRPRRPGRANRIDGDAMTFHDREPPPSTIRSRSMTRASTQIGSSGGNPNTVTPADLHARDLARRLGRRERRLARPEPIAHGPVDVQAVRREHDARRVARRIALADDEDRVGRVLGREPVRLAERGRVGEGRVAGEQLVLDPERLERRDQPLAPGRVVRRVERWVASVVMTASVRCGPCASRPPSSTRPGWTPQGRQRS